MMALTFERAFGSLLVVRALSALVSNISDCDETYNYWEPTYHVLFGGGLQTWEYAPSNALRSYLYVLDHALFGGIFAFLLRSRVGAFYGVRLALAAKSAFCDALLLDSVQRSLGVPVGAWAWWFLLSSAGMFHASVSYLPSSFAMYFVALCWAFWSPARAQPRLAVACIAAAAIVGWPFAALIGVPLALELMFSREHGPLAFLAYASRAGIVLLGAVALADVSLYGRATVSTLNLLAYNVLPSTWAARGGAEGGAPGGSELYGTEPASFYLRNLALNFNAALPLALLALPALLLAPSVAAPPHLRSRTLAWLRLQAAALWLWVGFFSCVAHKEERFMFVAYAPLCVCAALSADALVRACARALSPRLRPQRTMRALALALALLTGALSASRVVAITSYYRAPIALYSSLRAPSGLPELHPAVRVAAVPESAGTACGARARLCVRGQWHRFPSSFFVPHERACLSFVRSAFRGQLPQPFAAENGTRAEPPGMNVHNADEPSRYVPLRACSYVVDFEPSGAQGGGGEGGDDGPRLSAERGWEVVRSVPFLDARRSPALTRALWLPWLSARKNAWGQYVLLKRVPAGLLARW